MSPCTTALHIPLPLWLIPALLPHTRGHFSGASPQQQHRGSPKAPSPGAGAVPSPAWGQSWLKNNPCAERESRVKTIRAQQRREEVLGRFFLAAAGGALSSCPAGGRVPRDGASHPCPASGWRTGSPLQLHRCAGQEHKENPKTTKNHQRKPLCCNRNTNSTRSKPGALSLPLNILMIYLWVLKDFFDPSGCGKQASKLKMTIHT